MARRDEPHLVEIGTAANSAEGGMIREFLGAHGIDCLVQGEHHSSLLGAVGFIELRLLVPAPVADEARTLVESFRNQAGVDIGSDPAGEPDDDESAEALEPSRARAALERRVRAARILSLAVPGLGLGHFTVGARLRGVFLLATWPVAIGLALDSGPQALGLVVLSTAIDFFAAPIAAAEIARRRPRPRLPRAQLRKPR